MADDALRRTVLAAARRLVRRRDQPTMNDLAEASGVAVRTLYRLFESREALLREAGLEPAPTSQERVLEAALQQVGRTGLARLSMDELAAAAGVSRATLYRIFPGKPALFAELIRVYSPWESVAAVLDEMPEQEPAEVIPAVATAIAGALRGRAALLLGLVFELLQSDPDTRPGLERGLARGLPDLLGYFERQMDADNLRRMDPVLAAQLLGGPIATHALTEPLAQALRPTRAQDTDPVAEIADAWLRAMNPNH
jgi:TetR/AcrR family transcriptional repressor of mexJK operon